MAITRNIKVKMWSGLSWKKRVWQKMEISSIFHKKSQKWRAQMVKKFEKNADREMVNNSSEMEAERDNGKLHINYIIKKGTSDWKTGKIEYMNAKNYKLIEEESKKKNKLIFLWLTKYMYTYLSDKYRKKYKNISFI